MANSLETAPIIAAAGVSPPVFAYDVAQLTITQGKTAWPHRGVRQRVFTIGRGSECDLVLGDPQFPEIHCYLWFRDGELRLRALTDQPLLTVNGEEIEVVTLHSGDRIRTGPYQWVVEIAEDSPGDDRRPKRRDNDQYHSYWPDNDLAMKTSRELLVEIQAKLARQSKAEFRGDSSAA